MKIVLIRPPEVNRIWVGIPKFFNTEVFLFPPLGLMQLKAYIEKHTSHEVIIYDSLIHKADYGMVARFTKETAAAVAGISAFTHSLIDVIETAKALKQSNPLIHISIGGPHTYSFFHESAYLLDSGLIDSVILGDGEIAFVKILDALDKNESFEIIEGIIYKNKNGEIVKQGGPAIIKNLDDLPFPSRNIPGIKQYYTPASSGRLMTTIITSRGCPYDCKFCNVNRKYRTRSAKNIADEMELCVKAGFKEIFFIDDTFNVTAEKVIDLSEEILKRRLKVKWGFKARCDNVNTEMLRIAKLAGCFRIQYGVETATREGLVSIHKSLSLEAIRSAFTQTKKAGIRTTAYFIIGFPNERNFSDIMETINFAQKIPADFAVFSLLSPYPDTEFYKEGVRRGVFDPCLWGNFIKSPSLKQSLPTCWQEHFTKEELIGFLKTAHRKFYYRPKIIINALKNIHSFRELERVLSGGVTLLKLEFFGCAGREL